MISKNSKFIIPGLVTAFLVAAVNLFAAAEKVSIVRSLDGYSSQIVTTAFTPQTTSLGIRTDAVAILPDDIWNSNYSVIQVPDGNALTAGVLTEVGLPQVPTLSTFIGIPDNAGVNVSATYESYDIIDDVDIIPAQIPEPEGGYAEPAAFSINMAAYSQDSFYPENLVEAGTPVIMNDVRMIQMTVFPVQYNPARHQLRVYRNINVSINYDGPVINPMTSRRPYLSEAFYPLYKMMLGNFDSYMAQLNITTVKRGSIVVIVPNIGSFSWKAPITRYTEWKRAKGYDVQLVTTSDINSSGRPTNVQIKSYLTNLYNNAETRPDFVMLVGDKDISSGGILVPDYPYNSYSSDHQYSCLNGSDWLPDVGVARAAVDNITELNAFISKVIVYEKEPDTSDDLTFLQKGVSIGTDQHAISPVWTCIWVKERLLQHGFTQVDTFFQRTGYTPPASVLTAAMTAGVGYVNYRGWAGASGWYEPSYNTGNLSSVNNINKPGIMTSIVCGTGNFGSGTDPCFGEVWIRMGSQTSPKGGPCFFGSTDGNTHTQWNNPITLGFYFGLLETGTYNFATAAIAGKMQQYRSYPRALSTIQQYFNTYNMLGDPECEMRITRPKTINASYPATVHRGENYVTINVSDNSENPIVGAYITLRMADSTSERFYSVGKTDDDGVALLRLPTDTTGTLAMTITGRDLMPFFGNITVVQGTETIVFHSVSIKDDTTGFSRGNGDAQANPSETIELSIALENTGSTDSAIAVNARLVPLETDKIVIYRDIVNYGNILSGQIDSGNGSFVIGVLPAALDGQTASFRLEVASMDNPQGWKSYFSIPIAAPKLTVGGTLVSGNGRLDPNETASIRITIKNQGHVPAPNVTGTLSTTEPTIQATGIVGNFGTIAVNDSANNDSTQFMVVVDATAFKGKTVPFTVNLTDGNGVNYTADFNLTIGTIATTDPSGPDAYGYYVYDNTDLDYPEHPTWAWTDIRTLGTNLNLGDDASRVVTLPFNFVYYGQTYRKITICSNGWISMDSTHWADFRNWPFPDPSNCPAMIAPFWDDLVPSGTNNVYHYSDTANHKYVIQWYNLTGNTYTATQNFQVILYDPAYYPSITGDGIFEFLYRKIKNGETDPEENYATIGWENPTESIGFNISYSNQWAPGCVTLSSTANDSLKMYRITTNTGRGGISGIVTANGGDNRGIRIQASTGQSITTTDNTGNYRLAGLAPGSIDIVYSKTGWFPQTVTGISISANAYTAQSNIALEQCPIPTNLAASDSLDDRIHLTWTAVSHADLAGYDIYRSRWERGIYAKINSAPVVNNFYSDTTVSDSNAYWYYIVATYSGTGYQAQSLGSAKEAGYLRHGSGIDSENELPTQFALAQNYPNPFNAQTIINYSLPISGKVTLDIFNVLGQKVVTLIDGYQEAGYKSVIWNGRDNKGQAISSGVYFYRLATPEKNITKQMLMLK